MFRPDPIVQEIVGWLRETYNVVHLHLLDSAQPPMEVSAFESVSMSTSPAPDHVLLAHARLIDFIQRHEPTRESTDESVVTWLNIVQATLKVLLNSSKTACEVCRHVQGNDVVLLCSMGQGEYALVVLSLIQVLASDHSSSLIARPLPSPGSVVLLIVGMTCPSRPEDRLSG